MYRVRLSNLFRVGAVLGLAAIILLLERSNTPASEQAATTVQLTIDYNDGCQKRFTAIEWVEGMTVLDAMQKAKNAPHGITFEFTGSGETAFLTQIDDLKNEGGGKEKKNWQYWVSGSYADKSFGAWKLNSGDCVLWKFDTYRGK
jgi:hypothetical protein